MQLAYKFMRDGVRVQCLYEAWSDALWGAGKEVEGRTKKGEKAEEKDCVWEMLRVEKQHKEWKKNKRKMKRRKVNVFIRHDQILSEMQEKKEEYKRKRNEWKKDDAQEE